MPYLDDLINDHKAIENNSSELKIQINMQINFISSNDAKETRIIYVWSDDEEIRQSNETDDIIEKLFESFLTNYEKQELILKNGSNFVFEIVNLLSYQASKEENHISNLLNGY